MEKTHRIDTGDLDQSWNTRPTIAYLASRVATGSTSMAMWSGVVAGAQEHDLNLIGFVGGNIAEAQANIVYDLVTPEICTGIVTWSITDGSDQELEAIHARYQPLPMVTVIRAVPGHPVVTADDYQGVQEAVAHLIETHGCRRIAFIRAPDTHLLAEERYRAYLETLANYGIPFDPALVTPAWDWAKKSGERAVTLFMDERGLRPRQDLDAIVAASDLMAIGALEALQNRDIRVPEDLALVGHNNSAEAQLTIPSITSAATPLPGLSQQAVSVLKDLMEQSPVPEQVVVPNRLAIHQSCGCLDETVAQAAVFSPPGAAKTGQRATFAVRRKDVLRAMLQAVGVLGESEEAAWADKLLQAFIANLDAPDSGEFLSVLRETLRQVASAGRDVQAWQDALSAIQRHIGLCRDPHQAFLLLGQARTMIGKITSRVQARQQLQRERHVQTLHSISSALGVTFEVERLMDVLAEGLPTLGIPSCYLVLYEDPQPYEYPQPAPEWSRLILAYDENGRVALEPEGRRFLTRRILPEGMLPAHRRYTMVLQPLYFQEEQIGFVLFEVGPMDGSIYEVLRRQISSSLKGALLFDETRKAQAAAEKADSLKTRLLANVSHELRTPLNVIIGCAYEAANSPAPYGTVLPDALRDDLVHIHHSAEHQLRVINDLLDLSRAEIDELDLYLEILDPRPLLEEVFCSMADAGLHSTVTWRLQLPDRLPRIQADPVRLRQILFNLLSNADKFAQRGEIVLGAEVTPPHLHLWVQDTGPGISAELQNHIFEPFVTARRVNQRREGVGLGLSITRRLVLLHRGSMKLESQPGQGSTFHVYLPLPTLDDRTTTPTVTTRRVLLLISSHDRPPAEIVEFSQRQELEIYHLQASDDLDAVVQRQQPAALAWDMTDASPGDWVLIRRLRNHPKLSQAPFLLYGQEDGKEATLSIGMTNFVTKPTNDATLMDAINSICPSESLGPILIVDDDPQVLDLYRQVVAKGCLGYSVRTAADGAAAVSLMAEETPSLVILDLMMPEMDGFDVLDWMREGVQTRQVPVLVLSSRLLSFDDVKRIEQHALVTLQSKGVLSTDEAAVALNRAMFGIDTLPQHTSVLVKRIVAYFHQNYGYALSRLQVAEAIGVNADHLSEIFRREMSISPWEYLSRYRIMRAKELLRCTNDTVKNVALRVGFTDPAYFSRVFRNVTGISPSVYRKHPKAPSL